jgi:hypothetical protein
MMRKEPLKEEPPEKKEEPRTLEEIIVMIIPFKKLLIH